MLKDIRNVFRLEKENKQTKDIMLRDITNFFENEEEENYYKPVRLRNFWNNNHIEHEVTAIEIKHYQLKNSLIKLDHI